MNPVYICTADVKLGDDFYIAKHSLWVVSSKYGEDLVITDGLNKRFINIKTFKEHFVSYDELKKEEKFYG